MTKDGLISESFPLWLKSPTKGAKSQPYYPPIQRRKKLRVVIWHFFWEV